MSFIGNLEIRRRLLERPNVFAFFNFLIGVNDRTKHIIADYVKPGPDTVILDVACGRGDYAKALYPHRYFGVDNNPAYIEYAKNRFGKFGTFVCCDVADARQHTKDLRPNVAILIGVLHHLTTDQASTLLADIRDLLEPNGRVVSVDPVFTPEQGLTARLLAASDRGRFVRSTEEHLRLLGQSFSVVTADVRTDWLRIPYTHLACVSQKSA